MVAALWLGRFHSLVGLIHREATGAVGIGPAREYLLIPHARIIQRIERLPIHHRADRAELAWIAINVADHKAVQLFAQPPHVARGLV